MNNLPGDSYGIPDLGALKHRSRGTQNAKLKIGINNGLICPCGELIRDTGVTLFSSREEMIPTDKGPMPGVQLITINFHSRDCPAFKITLDGADLTHICVREISKTEWLEEGYFDSANNGNRPE